MIIDCERLNGNVSVDAKWKDLVVCVSWNMKAERGRGGVRFINLYIP